MKLFKIKNEADLGMNRSRLTHRFAKKLNEE